jgi:predicted ribosome quality control (RQC) complex YloA/Tae2 family protein
VRPSAESAALLAKALSELLVGRRLDRLWRPTETMLLLDFGAFDWSLEDAGVDGAPRPRLMLDAAPRAPAAMIGRRWPAPPSAPDLETLRLRGLLENARLAAVTLEAQRRLVFAFVGGDRRLVFQLSGRFPNLTALGAEEPDAPPVRAVLLPDRPAIDTEAPPLPGSGLAFHDLADTPARWLEAWSRASLDAREARLLDERRFELQRALRATRERHQRAAERLETQLAAASEAPALFERGELLKTVLREVPPKANSVFARNWFADGAPEVEIPLDPALTPAANLNRIFARYRKLVRTREDAEGRLLTMWEQISTLDDLLARATAASNAEALERLASEARQAGLRPRQQQHVSSTSEADGPRLPYRRFVAIDGAEIRLGRGAADNDALTFRHARGGDLFLHAHDVPGSHVILRERQRGAPPHPEALLDAATLAAWHSKARGEPVIDVMYTPRKHVRKPKGAAAGRVSVAAVKTVAVRVDQGRLARLYADAGLDAADARP